LLNSPVNAALAEIVIDGAIPARYPPPKAITEERRKRVPIVDQIARFTRKRQEGSFAISTRGEERLVTP
jgi:hypothetical protein